MKFAILAALYYEKVSMSSLNNIVIRHQLGLLVLLKWAQETSRPSYKLKMQTTDIV